MQRDLGIEDIAAQAMMSTRTLSRRFREQTGTTLATAGMRLESQIRAKILVEQGHVRS